MGFIVPEQADMPKARKERPENAESTGLFPIHGDLQQ